MGKPAMGTINDTQRSSKGKWWRIRDLNPGPTDYDSAALTAELIRHVPPATGTGRLLRAPTLVKVKVLLKQELCTSVDW
jgi:hypothetical protein